MKRIKFRIYLFAMMRCANCRQWSLPFWDSVMTKLEDWGWDLGHSEAASKALDEMLIHMEEE